MTRRSKLLKPMHAQDELKLFVLVSALDVFATYLLLRHGGYTEGNPIARYFFHRWDMSGMVFFKFSMVGFVCVISHIVASSRPELARGMLRVATLIVFGVVIYSGFLYLRHGDAGLVALE